MGSYVGTDSNNTKTASQEWNDGSGWNPFDGYYEWRSWTMVGKGGNDTLTGGEKDDSIYGDYKLGAYSTTGISGNDFLFGRGGADKIYGEAGHDAIFGDYNDGSNRGAGDTLYGGGGNDVIAGEAGNDIIFGDHAGGSAQDNTVAGDDYLSGGIGSDLLYGEGGHDKLVGYGKQRNEIDTLVGGAGNDTFYLGDKYSSEVYYNGDGIKGYALILDFKPGEDKIQVRGSLSSYEVRQEEFGVTGNRSMKDTGVYFNNDLIAIVVDQPNVSLTSSHFTSV
ncbi:MAG: hypothetical protein Kow00121_43240 [Elainellaceae cyanobacterium]